MRLFRLLLFPFLAAALACGPSRLTPREAARDIAKDYPVEVTIRIPENAVVAKGSPEHARLVRLQDALARTGWFSSIRVANGDKERFQFRPAPSAPAGIRTAPRGFELPAAEAEFVRVLPGLETTPDGARVAYLIRLVRPTRFFPLFQALHPDVRLGDSKPRHAAYRRQGRDWVLAGTDEFFRRAR